MRFGGWLLLVLAACTKTVLPDNGCFRKGGLLVQVGPAAARWKPLRLTGADVAYRDEATSATVMLDVQCGRAYDAPLGILTEHLIMGTTDRRFLAQDVIPFDGREALHSVMQAKLDGVPMHYDMYVTKKDGCVADIVCVAPPEEFEAEAADCDRFALGTHTRWVNPVGNVASDP
jgi:hypothetical protein